MDRYLPRRTGSLLEKRREMSFEVPHVEPLLAFVDSLRDPMQAELGAFDFDLFRSGLERRLATRLSAGPIRFRRRTAFFIAEGTG
jgi:hypothetical protein